MSIRDALEFIQIAYRDDKTRARIAELDPQDDLDEIVALASNLGLVFTTSELRAAFAKDWNMRQLFYKTALSNDSAAMDQKVP